MLEYLVDNLLSAPQSEFIERTHLSLAVLESFCLFVLSHAEIEFTGRNFGMKLVIFALQSLHIIILLYRKLGYAYPYRLDESVLI